MNVYEKLWTPGKKGFELGVGTIGIHETYKWAHSLIKISDEEIRFHNEDLL